MKNKLYIGLFLFALPFFTACGPDEPAKPDEVVIEKVVAFPGADGAGKYASGGRGGKVIYVTNLNDSGTGSLREAIEYLGSRIVVFSVSGTISLASPLRITNPNITIAGQTAPGDGICIKGCTSYIEADNVIIQFIRFRLGDVAGITQEDALSAYNTRNVMIDHCTMSWSVDECASFYDNENFTLQWCLLSESLTESIHAKGSHGYGGIWGGWNASFHHNLLAHHNSRNPRFCGSRFSNAASKERVDFRNNVIYNWGSNSGYGGEGGEFNMVNNYYKPGPATLTNSTTVQKRIFAPNADVGDYAQAAGVWGKFYVAGNYVNGFTDITADNWSGGVQPNPGTYPLSSLKLTAPTTAEPMTTQTAQDAYTSVLSFVGASLVRDAVDLRIINDVTNGTYSTVGSNGSTLGIIDNQTDTGVGGWPTLNSTTAPTDSDVDGIPDTWEDANGLNKYYTTDAKAKNLDPNGKLTNIEVYLHSLVAHLYP